MRSRVVERSLSPACSVRKSCCSGAMAGASVMGIALSRSTSPVWMVRHSERSERAWQIVSRESAQLCSERVSVKCSASVVSRGCQSRATALPSYTLARSHGAAVSRSSASSERQVMSQPAAHASMYRSAKGGATHLPVRPILIASEGIAHHSASR